MLFKNKLCIIFIYLVIILLSISAINAFDVDNQTLTDTGSENLVQDIGIDNNQSLNEYNQDVSGGSEVTDGWASFTMLRLAVSVPGNVFLTTNYRYDNAIDRAELNLEGVKIANPVTIDGQNHILDGAMQSYIFRISAPNVVLKNIVFQNARSQGGQCPDNLKDGSAVYIINSQVTIINCTFLNNMATRNGGAVFANTASTLDISNSKFTSNSAMQSGGAVYGKKITLTNDEFTSNTATNNGGAVYSSNYVKSTGSKFNQNSASGGKGGAVYKESIGDGIFRNNAFERNRAQDGGGIYSDNLITLSNSSFSFNTASNKGGAVYTEALHTDSNIINIQRNYNYFYSNTADRGGAIYTKEIRNDDGSGGIEYDGTLVYCCFVSNSAHSQGGAIYMDSEGGNYTIRQCNFRTNSIDEGRILSSGSAMYVDGSGVINIRYNVFVDNKMDGECAAVYIDPSVELNVANNWWGANEIFFTINNYIKNGMMNVADSNNIRMVLDEDVHVLDRVGEVIVRITANGRPPAYELLKLNVSALANIGTVSLPVVSINDIRADYVQMQEGFGKVKVIIDNQAVVKRIIYDDYIEDPSYVGAIITGCIVFGGFWTISALIYILTRDDDEASSNGMYDESADGSPYHPFTSLQEAIDKADENSIIYLAPGTYLGEGNRNLTINKNLFFYSSGNDVIIDAEGMSRIFNINSHRSIIHGVTFKNGLADVGGAIKFNNDLSDSFINATFINNGNGLGSALYFDKQTSNLNIIGKFINNSCNSIYFSQNSKDTSIADSLFLNSHVDKSIGDIYSSDGVVSLRDSWFGGNITDYVNVNNVDVLSYLFLNLSSNPKDYTVGNSLTVDLSLYSYDVSSGRIAKYSNNFNNLTLSLSSTTGSLDKSSVKLGEKFTFTPENRVSSIIVSVQNVTTIFYFIKDDPDFSKNNDTADEDSGSFTYDFPSVSKIVYSPGNNIILFNAAGAMQNNALNQADVENSQGDVYLNKNNAWLVVLLILLIGLSGVLIWKYRKRMLDLK